MKKLLILLLVFNTIGVISHKQAENRRNTITEVVYNGVRLELDVDEFKAYQKDKDGYVIEAQEFKNDDIVEYVTDSGIDDNSTGISDNNSLVCLGEFLLTGYCDCPICQEEWVGTTALGVAPTENNTIAVDPDVIPLGSYVWINGVRYHAEDVGGMINEYHIDIFCGSHEECYSDFCNGYADVYLEVGSE